MINIIASVVKYKDRLAIGKNGDLFYKLKKDLSFFKNTTTNNFPVNSFVNNKNIVLMGRKTYFSINEKYRPLENRINIVLTNDKKLINNNPIPKSYMLDNNLYFTDMKTFDNLYKKVKPNVFVAGGENVYKHFIRKADKIYLTITEYSTCMGVPDVFIEHPGPDYEIEWVSEKIKENDIDFRIVCFKKRNDQVKHQEENYKDLANNILKNGVIREDRTGTGTLSVFGTTLRFDISKNIPLLTTKKIPFKSVLEELLWFCRGDTDANILKNKNVNIWNGNTSREFLDKRGLNNYPEGILGAGYGWQIRHQGAKYEIKYADTSKIKDKSVIGGFDQLAYVEHLLKSDPFSRRIMMNYWNPSDFSKTALLPCHLGIQFYVEEKDNIKYLSGHFNMRSSDYFLGLPFNIASYTILVYILAKKCNMVPKELIYTGGDTHIYLNHIDSIKTQLTRIPRPFPVLVVADSVKNKDWSDITSEDVEVVGYIPHPVIKAPMAI